jgi:hypothetical protein
MWAEVVVAKVEEVLDRVVSMAALVVVVVVEQ